MDSNLFPHGRSYYVMLTKWLAKALAVFALVLLGPTLAKGQLVWTGANSSDWNDPLSWSTLSLPNSTTGVTLDAANGNQSVIATAMASSASLVVGEDDNSNDNTSLTIENGQALTTTGNATLGDLDHAQGFVNVTGAGSLWTVTGNLSVGNFGTGTLSISNGGLVRSSGVYSNISLQSGSQGSVLVDGANSTWNATGSTVNIGNGINGSGALTIANGGNASVYSPTIDGGTVSVSDPNSKLNFGGNISIGGNSMGALSITNGGQVIGAYNSNSSVGSRNNAGSVLVSDPNSSWIVDFSLSVGHYGLGSVSIANGGKVYGGEVEVETLMSVNGTNSTLDAGDGIIVTSGGSLTITNGGHANLVGQNDFSGGINGLIIGWNNPTASTVLVSDPNSILNTTIATLTVGYTTGIGNLVIANGGIVDSSTVSVANNDSTGTVTVSGNASAWNVLQGLDFGSSGNATLTIANGGAVTVGGILQMADINSDIAVINLNNAGTLGVGGTNGLIAGPGTVSFNFAGGTLAVVQSDLTTGVNATLFNGTSSTINTNGLNATWSGMLSGSGGLAKTGSGTLTLTGANTYTGTTTVSAGTLALDFSASNAPSANIVKSSSALVFNGGSLMVNGSSGITNSQTFASVQFVSGDSAVGLNSNGALGLNLTLGNATRSLGATAGFSPGTGNINLSAGVNGNIVLVSNQGVAYAVVGGSDWAQLLNGKVAAYSNYQTDPTAADWQITDNVSLNNGTANISSNQSIHTLRLAGNDTTGALAIANDATLTIAAGGLLDAGNGSFVIEGGNLTSGAATPELVVAQENTANALTIASNLVDGSSATALTKSGPGQLILTGINTYSGNTYLNNGVLTFGVGALGSGALIFSGGTLQWAQNNLQDISSQPVVFNSAGGTFDVNGQTITLANAVGGGSAGNLAITGNGTLVLAGNNSSPVNGYTGTTVITNAAVQFSSLNNFGAGELVFNNGTVQWAQGSAVDISAKAIQINNGGAIFDTNGNNVTLANTIGIFASGNVTKAGNGTLTLTNTESYSGATVVNGGTLQLGNGVTSGMVAGNIVVNNSANLAYQGNSTQQTYAGVISGNGQLSIASGNLVLSGTNSFSGNTTLVNPSSVLVLQNSLALQNSTLVYTAGQLDFWPFISSYTFGGLSGNLDLSLTSQGSSVFIKVGGNNLDTTYSGNITGTGNIMSAGTFNKIGNGTLTLTGNNTYAGRTYVTSGTLLLASSTASLGGDMIVNGTVVFNTPFDNSFNGTISGNGTVIKANSNTLTLSAVFSSIIPSGSSTFINAGTLTITAGINGSIIDNSTLVFAQNNSNTFSGTLSGNGTLFQAGNATLTINSTNSFNGTTYIQTGTLQLAKAGALQDSTLSYNPGNGNLSFGNLTSATLGGLTGDKDIALTNKLSQAVALSIGSNSQSTIYNGNFTGNGSVIKVGSGNLALTSNSIAGTAITVNAGTLTLSGNSANYSGHLTINGTLALDQNLNSTFSGVISGNGSLQQIGNSTLTLTNANSFSGNTFIANGTLALSNSSSLQNSTLNYTAGMLDFGNLSAATLGGLVGSQSVNLANDLAAPLALTVGGNNQTATFNGNLSGLGSLTKAGSGNLTLAGISTFTGNTTITGGTLTFNGDTSGLSGNIINNATLVYDQATASTVNPGISGSGQFIQAGSNILTLAGNSTYTGTTTVSSGTLAVTGILGGGGAVTLNANTSMTVSNGGLLTTNSLKLAATNGLNSNFTLGPNGTLQVGGTNGINATFSNYVLNLSGGVVQVIGTNLTTLLRATLANTTTIDTNGLNATWIGQLSGNGNLAKIGNGTLTLTADQATGMIAINTGTLNFNSVIPSGNIQDNATLVFSSTGLNTYGGAISGAGNIIANGSGSLLLTGNNTFTGSTTIAGKLLELANPLALQNSSVDLIGGALIFTTITSANLGGLSGNQDIQLDNLAGGSVALTINNNGQNTSYSGNLSGNGSLNIAGTGTWTLFGNNTYVGDTTVSSGILQAANDGTVSATGIGNLTISANATLSGNGQIGGNSIVNGSLSPGNGTSIGSLTFSQNLALGSSATAVFQLGGNIPGAQYGTVNIFGNLSLGGLLAIKLLNGFEPLLGDSFTLFNGPLSISSAFSAYFLPDLSDGVDWNVTSLSTNGTLATAAPTDYVTWATNLGLSGDSAVPAATPYGGPPNLIRYAMNLAPDTYTAELPFTGSIIVSGINYLAIQYRSRKNMTDYELVPQYSTDLVTWTNVDSGNITQLADDDTYTSRFQASVPMPASGAVFLRVSVEPP